MRKILGIAIALMLTLILLSPTLGYSVQTGNHSYTLKSARVNYSIGVETPSHAPAVLVTRVPYSLKYTNAVTQSANLTSEKAATEGIQIPPMSEAIGIAAKGNITVPAASANIATPATVERKFFIQGMVFNDQNGNGKMDNNETGLANWTVNLEQPSGNVISKFTTNNSGGYGFYDLIPGEHIVAEVQNIGWSITAPPNSRYAVNLTNNVTALDFGNEMIPEQTQNMTVPSNVTSSSNVTSPENVSTLK